MMPDTFNPPVAPSPGTQVETDIALNKASFGDGYAQASPRGLRHMQRRVTLRWDVLTLDQAQEMDAFFRAQEGYRSFLYTVRGETEPRKWTCEVWSLSDDAPARFQAELVESFSV